MSSRCRRARLLLVAVAALSALAVLPTAPARADDAGTRRDSIEIIGGSVAAPGQFPYQVGLLDHATSDPFDAQFCGGSIISPTAVLTAAHCVENDNASNVDVLSGSLSLTTGIGQRARATAIHIHPQWNTNTSAYDAAIVEVATPLVGAPVLVVQPGHDSLFSAGTNVTITGWGATAIGNDPVYAVNLRKVTLPTTSDSTCRAVYGAAFQSSNMFCAGLPQGGKDSCQGDSGGPVAVRAGNNWVQVGIVSWGWGCALPGVPGVNSRISRLASFIGPHLEPRPHPFYDIAPWLADTAAWIADNEVMAGFSDGTFGPGGDLTRAQAVRLLWRLQGSPSTGGPHGFNDVPPWIDDAVRWAAHDPDGAGGVEPIVIGYGNSFRPGDAITRGAWSRMLHRIDNETPATVPHAFTDVPDWVTGAVSWLTDPVNVPPFAEGFGDTTFRPQAQVTRGQAARMVFRIHGTV